MKAFFTAFLVGAMISVPYALFALFAYGQPNPIVFGTMFLIGFAVSFSPREAFAKTKPPTNSLKD